MSELRKDGALTKLRNNFNSILSADDLIVGMKTSARTMSQIKNEKSRMEVAKRSKVLEPEKEKIDSVELAKEVRNDMENEGRELE